MKYIEDNKFNQKIYFEIGEEFDIVSNGNSIKLQCIENTEEDICKGCIFLDENYPNCKGIIFPFACEDAARLDEKNVVFIKL